VKFLFWQFALYALAAFNLGALCVHFWWQPRHDAARRSAKARGQQIETLQASLAAEQTARARDTAIVAQLPQLTEDLNLARQALKYVEVELEASAIRRDQVQTVAADLQQRLSSQRTAVDNVGRLEQEISRLREELNESLATAAADRASAESQMARINAALRNADDARKSLQKRHDEFVLSSQRDLSVMTVRAESAERQLAGISVSRTDHLVSVGSQTEVSEHATDSVILDLRGDTGIVHLPGEPASAKPHGGAVFEPDSNVIDLRFTGE
jgi:chromosome segregation ATPase